MRVAVIYIPAGAGSPLAATAKALARGLEGAGHRVDLVEARPGEYPRLTGYEYVCLGTEPTGLAGKIPGRVAEYLAQAGTVSGKRSMAFVRKRGLAPDRALKRLMAAMEAEGMVVNCAEVLSGPDAAEGAARAAPVERN